MDKHTNELGYMIVVILVIGLLIGFLNANYTTYLTTLWTKLMGL